ncbi:MAG: hypothetical protein IJ246_02975, partial [Clostridia bacterium]|nr:hypothetical protein [Clostridia bacterium]
ASLSRCQHLYLPKPFDDKGIRLVHLHFPERSSFGVRIQYPQSFALSRFFHQFHTDEPQLQTFSMLFIALIGLLIAK